MASERETIADKAKRFDADGVPLPQVARAFGYQTWEEWTTAMTRPSPLLVDIPFVQVDDATYRASPARLAGDATGGTR